MGWGRQVLRQISSSEALCHWSGWHGGSGAWNRIGPINISDGHGFANPCGFAGMGHVGTGTGWTLLTLSEPVPSAWVPGYPHWDLPHHHSMAMTNNSNNCSCSWTQRQQMMATISTMPRLWKEHVHEGNGGEDGPSCLSSKLVLFFNLTPVLRKALDALELASGSFLRPRSQRKWESGLLLKLQQVTL